MSDFIGLDEVVARHVEKAASVQPSVLPCHAPGCPEKAAWVVSQVAIPGEPIVHSVSHVCDAHLGPFGMPLPSAAAPGSPRSLWRVKRIGADADFLLSRDGDQWCAVLPGFVNLQESPAGFSDDPTRAIDALFVDAGMPIPAEAAATERAALPVDLRSALASLVAIVDAAGLHNLSNGVQLGPVSWYVKASESLERAKRALASAESPFDADDFHDAVSERIVPLEDRYDLPADAVERGEAVYRIVQAPVAIHVRRYLGEDGEGGGVFDRETRIPIAGLTTAQAVEAALRAKAEVEG